MRNGLKTVLSALLFALLASSYAFSQEEEYIVTGTQLTELMTIIEGQKKKADAQAIELASANESIQRLNRELSEQSKSLRKSARDQFLDKLEVGAVSFSIGVIVGGAAVFIMEAKR